MRIQLDPRDYLPVTTIKSYFSRRAVKKKKKKSVDIDYDDGKMNMLDTTREEALGPRALKFWLCCCLNKPQYI